MRNRSMALVIRDHKILMERLCYNNRYFYSIPGGGIEDGETPEEAAIRELQEECGLNGTVVRKLTEIYTSKGNTEYVFLVKVSEDQQEILGYDPEELGGVQAIREVRFMDLKEISEKDRAFLWSYGLMGVEEFWEELNRWGDVISYPTLEERCREFDSLKREGPLLC